MWPEGEFTVSWAPVWKAWSPNEGPPGPYPGQLAQQLLLGLVSLGPHAGPALGAMRPGKVRWGVARPLCWGHPGLGLPGADSTL